MGYERVNHLVDIYIDHKLGLGEDAGWHGETMLSRMIEFKGDLPMSTGNDQADLKMINEIRYIRNDHHELPHALRSINALDDVKYCVLIANSYLNKRTFNVGGKEVRYDRFAISKILEITPDSYKNNLKAARKRVAEMDNRHRDGRLKLAS